MPESCWPLFFPVIFLENVGDLHCFPFHWLLELERSMVLFSLALWFQRWGWRDVRRLSRVLPVTHPLGLRRWLSGKESACQWRRWKRCRFDPWVGKIPWRRKGQPTPVFLPGESPWERHLAGYSPWGRKEPDTPEWLSTQTQKHWHARGQECHGLSGSGPRAYPAQVGHYSKVTKQQPKTSTIWCCPPKF